MSAEVPKLPETGPAPPSSPGSPAPADRREAPSVAPWDDVIDVASSPCAMPPVLPPTGVDAQEKKLEPPPPPPPSPAEPAPTRRSPSGGGALAGLALLVAAMTAVLVLSPWPLKDDQAALKAHLSALDKQVADLRASAAGLPALSARVDALEKAPASDTAALAQRVEAAVTLAATLAERIAALEASAGQAPSASAPSASPRALDSEIDALRGQVETLSQSLSSATAQLAQRLDGADARLAAAANDLGSRPTENAFADVQRRLATLEQNDVGVAMHRATLALAVSALGATVRSGAPYAEDMAVVANLAAGEPAVALLSKHAATGVKPPTALAASFPDAARRALAVEREAAKGGFWSGIWQSMTSLVSVRRTDGRNGDATETVLARMQGALAAGDLSAALTASDGLGESARKSLGPWLAEARARQDSETALRALQTKVLTDLGRAPQTAPPALVPPVPSAAPAVPQ